MIALGPIVDRLEGAGFPKVGGVLEWAGLKSAPAYSPALFVIPDTEAAGESRMSGIHDQRVVEKFRVIVVLKPSFRIEGKPSVELKIVVDQVIDAIAAWKHPDATAPCEYAGGRLLSADGWGVAWAVDFRTAWRLRKGSQ